MAAQAGFKPGISTQISVGGSLLVKNAKMLTPVPCILCLFGVSESPLCVCGCD